MTSDESAEIKDSDLPLPMPEADMTQLRKVMMKQSFANRASVECIAFTATVLRFIRIRMSEPGFIPTSLV